MSKAILEFKTIFNFSRGKELVNKGAIKLSKEKYLFGRVTDQKDFGEFLDEWTYIKNSFINNYTQFKDTREIRDKVKKSFNKNQIFFINHLIGDTQIIAPIYCDHISRKHFTLIYVQDIKKYILLDHSSNGTNVNGKMIHDNEIILEDKSLITFEEPELGEINFKIYY